MCSICLISHQSYEADAPIAQRRNWGSERVNNMGFLNACSDSEAYTLSVALARRSGNRDNHQIGNFLPDLSTHPKLHGYVVLLCLIPFS